MGWLGVAAGCDIIVLYIGSFPADALKHKFLFYVAKNYQKNHGAVYFIYLQLCQV